MNINRYNRKCFRGFMYNLWLIFLEVLGINTINKRWEQHFITENNKLMKQFRATLAGRI